MNYYGDHKWTAGAGTTVTAGIAAGIAGLNAITNGNGLGGLFGGGNNAKLQEALSENAMLKAEKYSDTNDAKLYEAVRGLERKQAKTETDVICLQKELTAYAAGQKEVQELRQQLTDCKINGVSKDLGCLAGKVETGFIGINSRFAGVDAAIAGFTKTVIPASAICDTSNCGSCPQQ